jgi:hypothetical protein
MRSHEGRRRRHQTAGASLVLASSATGTVFGLGDVVTVDLEFRVFMKPGHSCSPLSGCPRDPQNHSRADAPVPCSARIARDVAGRRQLGRPSGPPSRTSRAQRGTGSTLGPYARRRTKAGRTRGDRLGAVSVGGLPYEKGGSLGAGCVRELLCWVGARSGRPARGSAALMRMPSRARAYRTVNMVRAALVAG